MENQIKNITVIGTGVIGKGWITRFLTNGYDVTAFDIAKGAKAKLYADLEKSWPKLVEKGVAKTADLERLQFADSFKAAVEKADFIQENAPEREDIKCSLLAE